MSKQVISKDQMMESRAGFMKNVNGTTAIVKASSSPTSWNAEKRSARFVMTSQAVDRYGDIVMTQGLTTKNFEANPVVLWAHNSRGFPIGTWADMEKVLDAAPRMEGTANFVEEGVTEEATATARLVSLGVLRACSIGFSPDWDAAEPIYDDEDQWTGGIKWMNGDLLECSICSIPANPDALSKDLAGDDLKFVRTFVEDVLDNWAIHPETKQLVSRKDYDQFWKDLSGKGASVTVNLPELKSEPGILERLKKAVGIIRDEPPAPVVPKLASATDKARLLMDIEEIEARAS